MDEEHEMSSLRDRRMKSPMKISCFKHRRSDPSVYSSSASPSIITSPSNWLKSKFKSNDNTSPSEQQAIIKPGRHRRNRSGGGRIMSCINRHRRHSSAELNYDPLSYALNFEEDDFPVPDIEERNFASRLPVSPRTSMSPMSPHRSRLPLSPDRTRRLEELAARMEALDITSRGRGDQPTTPARGKASGELRNNIFEVREPRLKPELPRGPTGSTSTTESAPKTPDRDIMVQTC